MDNLLIFFEILVVNLLLSGDNAIVIAMVSSHLPVWQRNKAIWWGTFAAILLRCLLVIVALPLLKVPYLQAIGGVLLFIIAVKLLLDTQSKEENQLGIAKKMTIGAAIWTILTADFIMSLDNVLAIAAVAHGDLVLIMLGIVISIPIIIWGSKVIQNLIHKYRFISFIGSALLAFAAGEMFIKDKAMQLIIEHALPGRETLIPLLCVPLVIIAGILKKPSIVEKNK